MTVSRASQSRLPIDRATFGYCKLGIVRAADAIAIRGTGLHALSEDARAICQAIGFYHHSSDPLR